MAEYIEREKLITELNNIAIDLLKDNSIQCGLAAGTVVDIKDNIVAKQPIADVVEVVRCKDCKHWGDIAFGFICRKFSGIDKKICMGTDQYCSYGERKESV